MSWQSFSGQITDAKACAPSDSTVLEIGFWRQKSGGRRLVRLVWIRLCCFVPGIPEWARHN